MESKTALVIGGSDGIGFETARQLLKEGYKVINASRKPSENKAIINITLDVSNGADIDKALIEIEGITSGLDVMVYSAGYSMASEIENVNEKDYRYLFEVNFFGALHSVKAALPLMKSVGRGKIIFVSSAGGVIPIPYDPYYSASKAALNMLCLALNAELNKENIYITSIMPGGVRTKFSFRRETATADETALRAAEALKNMEQNGIEADKVARCIVRAVSCSYPPIFVYPGIKNMLECALSAIFPKKLLIKIVSAIF
jgi:short-subunit dehydrogenase